MEWAIVAGALMIAIYFALRYYILKNALRQTTAQVTYIEENVTQNRRLHLSVPDNDLEKLSVAINQMIDCFQAARIRGERRERAFQGQIESISHDLRTPLTVIVGYVSMLRQQQTQGTLAPEALEEMLEVLQRKASGMEHLVNQFYEYSRLVATDVSLSCEAVDFGKAARETLLDNSFLLEQAGIEVAWLVKEAPIWVFADETALERAITNLLQNVARYAKNSLRIEMEETSDDVSLLLTNNTEVLAEKDMDKLFERFYAADAARTEGSTGLGLTIAKGLVEEMAGNLEAIVESSQSEQNGECWVQFKLTLQKLHV